MEYDSVSVKVMRSYDYCHFEIVLGQDTIGNKIQPAFNEHDVNEMRKEAARLVDEGVRQYIEMKKQLDFQNSSEYEFERRQAQLVKVIKNFPDKSQWTPEIKALEKRCNDLAFQRNRDYDYQDDWAESQISDEREDDEIPY